MIYHILVVILRFCSSQIYQSATDKPQLMDEESMEFSQELDVELPPFHIPQPQAMKVLLTNEDIESLSADLYQPVYTFMRRTNVHHNIANPEGQQREAPSKLSQEPLTIDVDTGSTDTDLGTLLASGDLGPISIDEINIESLFDSDMKALSNDTYLVENPLMGHAKYQPNSDSLSYLQTSAVFFNFTDKNVQNVKENGNRSMSCSTSSRSSCGQSVGSILTNFSQGFAQSGNFRHSSVNHTKQKPFQCDICPKQISTSSNYKRHQRTHTGEKPYQCDICEKSFRTSSNYKRHQRTHTGEKPYQCDICQKQLSTSSDYERHQRTHTGEKPYQCDICPSRFATSGNYKRHRGTHFEKKPFPCDICQKQFLTLSNFQNHRRMHTGEKPFQCNICQKQFRTLHGYRIHRRRHTGQMSFHCDICPKQFATSSNYRIHQRTHTGEKPFQCEMCAEQFSTSGNYKRHRQIHTGEKSFQCEICQRQFRDCSDYRTHRRIHTGEKPFQCDICAKQFSTSSNHRAHRRTHGAKGNYTKRDLIKHIKLCSSTNVSHTGNSVI